MTTKRWTKRVWRVRVTGHNSTPQIVWRNKERSDSYMPHEYAAVATEILTGDPDNLDLIATQALLEPPHDSPDLRRALSHYRAHYDDAARRAAYRAFALAPPKLSLLLNLIQESLERKWLATPPPGAALKAWVISYACEAAAIAFDKTGDESALKVLLLAGERLLACRDDALGRVDTVRLRVMPAWGVAERIVEGHYTNNVVVTGRLTYPFLRMAYASRKYPVLASRYERTIARVYTAMREAVLTFDDEFFDDGVTASYLRPVHNDFEPFNHVHALANSLTVIACADNDGQVKERVKRIASFFKSTWWTNENGTVSWYYQPLKGRETPYVPERIWKASITAQFPLLAYESGLALERADIETIARSFAVNVPTEDGTYSSRIGTSDKAIVDVAEAKGGLSSLLAWWPYGEYDIRVRSILEGVASVPVYGSWFRHPMSFPACAGRIAEHRINATRKRTTWVKYNIAVEFQGVYKDRIERLAKVRGETVEQCLANVVHNVARKIPRSLQEADRPVDDVRFEEIGISAGGDPYIKLSNGRIFFDFPSKQQIAFLYHLMRDKADERFTPETYVLGLEARRLYLSQPPKRDFPHGQDAIVVDAGAFIGYKAIAFQDALGSGGKTIAIELAPENYRLLRKNVEANDLADKIICHNIGVWSERRELPYTGKGWMQYSIANIDGKDYPRRGSMPVDTLDNIFSASNVDRIDYLNLQLNGAEAGALIGLNEWFDRVKVFRIAAYYKVGGEPVVEKVCNILQDRGCEITQRTDAGSITAYNPRFRPGF